MWTLSRVVCNSKKNLGSEKNHEPEKKRLIRKLRVRQQGLEHRSLQVLEQLNQSRSASERQKLSMDLSYLCKNVLDIQEQIDHMDTYILLMDTDSDTLDL
jgi:hypothetical protein